MRQMWVYHGFSKSRIPHTSHHLKSICHGFSFNFVILGCTRVPNFWTTQYDPRGNFHSRTGEPVHSLNDIFNVLEF